MEDSSASIRSRTNPIEKQIGLERRLKSVNPTKVMITPDALISGLSGLAGIFLGSLLTNRHQVQQRRLAWAESQLREFYAPMYALRTEIRTLSETRLSIQQALESQAKSLLETGDMPTELVASSGYQRTRNEIMRTHADEPLAYFNRQLVEHIRPGYDRMLEVFRDKLGYADIETQRYFPMFVKFVESWRRGESQFEFPLEIAQSSQFREAELHEFYDHLETKVKELKLVLGNGQK